MSSVVNKELQAIQNLQAKVKEAFPESVTKASTYAKELYKVVRNNSKKLDDVLMIEAKLKAKEKVTEEQMDKVKNKESYIQVLRLTLENFELFKKTDFAESQKAAAEAAA